MTASGCKPNIEWPIAIIKVKYNFLCENVNHEQISRDQVDVFGKCLRVGLAQLAFVVSFDFSFLIFLLYAYIKHIYNYLNGRNIEN